MDFSWTELYFSIAKLFFKARTLISPNIVYKLTALAKFNSFKYCALLSFHQSFAFITKLFLSFKNADLI